MIVRDEAKIITRCLDSVRHLIDDYVILDTGSKDNTIPIIRDYFKQHNIPGIIRESKFKDFSSSRNEAYRLCKNSEYILLIDADMRLVINSKFNKNNLVADAYYLDQTNGDLKYENIRLVKYNKDFIYKGVTHEYLDVNYAITDRLTTLSINDFNDGGSKKEKFTRDIKLLEVSLEAEPENTRSLFYLANSYKDSGNYPKALHFYKRRIEKLGWSEERYVACTYAIQCLAELAKPTFEVLALALYAQKILPHRIEALYEALKYVRCVGNEEDQEIAYDLGQEYMNSIPQTGLFLDKSINEWKYFDELSILAYLNQDKYTYRLLINKILDEKLYTKDQEERILRNAEFYKEEYEQVES